MIDGLFVDLTYLNVSHNFEYILLKCVDMKSSNDWTLMVLYTINCWTYIFQVIVFFGKISHTAERISEKPKTMCPMHLK